MTNQEKLIKIMNDPKLWIETFCKIANKEGKIIPFLLNCQQKDFLMGMEKYNCILKSRQLGFSTLVCALSVYYACTQPNTTSLLLSYSIDSANGIYDKLKQIYFELPPSIRHNLINNSKKELKLSNNSKIVVATAGNKDVARGLTLNGVVHISEMAFMKDTINKQLLAIEQACADNCKIIIESTANGLNYFYELYSKAENHDNLYKPFFYSWVDDKIMFKKEYERFKNVYIDRHGHALNDSELDTNEKYLLSLGANYDQLMWRRLKINNSSEEQFRQEFPATPQESFITSGNAIFNNDFIYERLQHVTNGLDKKQLRDLPNILKVKHFTIWQESERRKRYFVGCDSADGIGQDYSVITVLDDDLQQMAEFRSNITKPYELTEMLYHIAIYYNNAFVCVEKASSGTTVLDRLRHDKKYTNLYKYKSFDARGRTKKKIGFNSNETTRQMILNNLIECIETNQTLIQSKYMLEEMKTFHYGKNGKMEHPKGYHDDCVFSYALAIEAKKAGINYYVA